MRQVCLFRIAVGIHNVLALKPIFIGVWFEPRRGVFVVIVVVLLVFEV
jgi:hypothetical protein